MTESSPRRYMHICFVSMALLARAARLPSRTIWRSLGLFGMVIGLFLTAIFSSRIGELSALHPVLALLLFWACLNLISNQKSDISY